MSNLKNELQKEDTLSNNLKKNLHDDQTDRGSTKAEKVKNPSSNKEFSEYLKDFEK